MCADEVVGKPAQKSKTWTQLGHFLSVAETAQRLSVNVKTIKRWCDSGKLPAMAKPYGKSVTYLISPAALSLLEQERLHETEAPKKEIRKPHSEYVAGWKKAMAKGLIAGRAFSPHTIDSYSYYVDEFFKKHRSVSLESLKLALAALPVESVSVKEKLYKALVCLAKYLIMENAFDKSFLEQAKPLAPKYHKPPKRHTVPPDGIESLHNACESSMERVLLLLLSHTGLRASELCALRLGDINLAQGFLIVRCGKGGKQRKVGLSRMAIEELDQYLAELQLTLAESRLFINGHGKPMNRYNLYQLLQRIGKRASVKVHPHALRRSFVTINANKGRPLQMLQIACGHSKITTTMSYCRTSEDEVIQAMREWD